MGANQIIKIYWLELQIDNSKYITKFDIKMIHKNVLLFLQNTNNCSVNPFWAIDSFGFRMAYRDVIMFLLNLYLNRSQQ